MAKAVALLIAFALLSTIVFADAAGAAKAKAKMDALGVVVKPLLKSGESATYDNFIGAGGTEYAVISINFAPSFLAAIMPDGTGYKVDFIRDNATMRQIMENRLSAFNFSYVKVDAQSELHPLFLQFNASRRIPDAKCTILLGIANAACIDEQSCGVACGKSVVCAYYMKNDSSIPSQMKNYSDERAAIDAIMSEEASLSASLAGKDADAASAKKYGEMVAALRNSAARIASLPLQDADSACPPVRYDLSPLAGADAKVSLMITTAGLLEQKNSAITGIQQASVQRLQALQETIVVDAAQISNAGKETVESANGNPQAAPGKPAAPKAANAAEPVKMPNEKPPLQGVALDLWRIAAVVLIAALAAATAHYYWKKRKGRLGGGLRI